MDAFERMLLLNHIAAVVVTVPQVGYPIIFDTFYKSMKMKRFHVALLVGILLVGSTLGKFVNQPWSVVRLQVS